MNRYDCFRCLLMKEKRVKKKKKERNKEKETREILRGSIYVLKLL
jgi:hypothetical protein